MVHIVNETDKDLQIAIQNNKYPEHTLAPKAYLKVNANNLQNLWVSHHPAKNYPYCMDPWPMNKRNVINDIKSELEWIPDRLIRDPHTKFEVTIHIVCKKYVRGFRAEVTIEQIYESSL